MRLQPDADALAFAEAVRDLLTNVCDAQALRDAWDGADGRVPGLWKRLAEMGVTGLVVPENFDGAGLDLSAALPIFVEAGRAALPEPLAATAAASMLLARTGGPLAQEWLPRIAAGDAVVAIGDGSLLVGGAWADLFLLGAANGVRAVGRDDVQVEAVSSIDPGVGLARVTVDSSAGQPLDGADGAAACEWGGVAGAGSALLRGEIPASGETPAGKCTAKRCVKPSPLAGD